MPMILNDKARSPRRSTLDEVAKGYEAFDQGAARKAVIDPHGMFSLWELR
jgi:hypothetical protein